MHHPLLLQDRRATNPLEIGMCKSLTLGSCRIPTDNLYTSKNQALLKDNSASMPATDHQDRARASNFEGSLSQAPFLAHRIIHSRLAKIGGHGRPAALPVKCRQAGSNDSFAYKYQPSRLSCTTTINRPRIVNYDSENTIGCGPGARTVVLIRKRYLLTMSSLHVST